jgi:hypothetical protein
VIDDRTVLCRCPAQARRWHLLAHAGAPCADPRCAAAQALLLLLLVQCARSGRT